ncbi:hypothetical protein L6164_037496 [Bauhinia variegata]|uniref:Uncharacterized protein n=1 Tax=Bauhinia variegata TaxID=167791 RepID=A0ACB9KL00_BAUVA|nr:hypothetical protein L6164_037496 [Bauhinia variegata]
MQGSSQPPIQENQEKSYNQRAVSASAQPKQEGNQSERKNETKKRKPNASGAKKTSIAWEHFDKLPDVKESLQHVSIVGGVPNYRGETIGKYIDECLKDWGVKAIVTITVDNASSNDVAISYLKKRIKSLNGLVLDGELLHVRCCAHILNLIVNNGLKDMHASIFSIRNAMRFVRSSPSRFAKFKDCANFASLPSKGLVCLDVPTRWNLTYLILEASLWFQAAFEKCEDDDRSYVEHFGELGSPSASDWLNANVILKFLKIFYDATMVLSGTLHITANNTFQ